MSKQYKVRIVSTSTGKGFLESFNTAKAAREWVAKVNDSVAKIGVKAEYLGHEDAKSFKKLKTKPVVAEKPRTLADAILEYMAFCKADYDKGNNKRASGIRSEYAMTANPGRKFIRLVKTTDWGRGPEGRSSHSFIVKQAHTTSGGLVLKVGDILMCATFHQPALNHVRGNVIDRNYGKSSWTGTGYMI